MDYIICHYSEIGLKGKNRKFFEEKLVENIKKTLKKKDHFSFVRRISGRILIKLGKKGREKKKEIIRLLKSVFGIANFAFAQEGEAKIEEIEKRALKILEGKKFKSFKIATQRSDKTFPFTSQEVNERVGEYILKNLKTQYSKRKSLSKNLKVDLTQPDITVFIEIVEGKAFFFLAKIRGAGGLPVTTGGRAIALLSGGIDSPVAAYFVMRRGVRIIFVHFHAYPYTQKASIEKAKKIVKIFEKYQFTSRLYLVPFAKIQEEIVLKSPSKIRMVLYRRAMMKIAEKIAQKEKAQALVTGESIGQVASQTLENIRVIDEAVRLPIFRPLLGFDKEEIIRKAKEIETFEISILPHEDCCLRFLPKYPETKGKLEEIKEVEKKIPLISLMKKVLLQVKIIKL